MKPFAGLHEWLEYDRELLAFNVAHGEPEVNRGGAVSMVAERIKGSPAVVIRREDDHVDCVHTQVQEQAIDVLASEGLRLLAALTDPGGSGDSGLLRASAESREEAPT